MGETQICLILQLATAACKGGTPGCPTETKWAAKNELSVCFRCLEAPRFWLFVWCFLPYILLWKFDKRNEVKGVSNLCYTNYLCEELDNSVIFPRERVTRTFTWGTSYHNVRFTLSSFIFLFSCSGAIYPLRWTKFKSGRNVSDSFCSF